MWSEEAAPFQSSALAVTFRALNTEAPLGRRSWEAPAALVVFSEKQYHVTNRHGKKLSIFLYRRLASTGAGALSREA